MFDRMQPSNDLGQTVLFDYGLSDPLGQHGMACLSWTIAIIHHVSNF
jgi:hypothetical protein